MNTKNKVNLPVIDILPYKGRLIYAFSLIELSIVLIIIGLLVAGVTGGKSLIESAKTRALMNEIRGYKQAVNTFYVANDRFPGDANRDGVLDEKDNDIYDFPSPYNINDDYLWHSAPWIEMYLDKIIDFRVDPDAIFEHVRYSNGGAAPLSKVYKDYIYNLSDRGDYCYLFNSSGKEDMCNNKDVLSLGNMGVGEYWTPEPAAKHRKLLHQIDQKMDDGRALNGNILSLCQDDKGDGVDDYLDSTTSCYGLRTFFDF